MAVYFDNRIQASSVTANTDLLWHSSYALLAVSSENSAGVGGSVNFYLDEVCLITICTSLLGKLVHCKFSTINYTNINGQAFVNLSICN